MKISIITVCLNRAETIERCIKSVIGQGYKELEYIIIDGGSTDGTLDIVRKYEKYISYWVSEPDKGIYDAMNKGIDASTGDVIAFLNSDDWYEEGTLCYAANEFVDNNIQLLCGHTAYYYKDKLYKASSGAGRAVLHDVYPQPAMFAARELFFLYGKFDTKYRIVADFEWQLRVFDKSVSVKVTNRILTNFSLGGVSSNGVHTIRIIDENEAGELAVVADSNRYSESQKQDIMAKIKEFYGFKRKKIDLKNALTELDLKENCALRKKIMDIFTEPRYSVFGIGMYGKEIIHILEQIGTKVTCIWDNNEEMWGRQYKNISIRSPKEINRSGEIIIISPIDYETDIAAQLNLIGMKKDRDYIIYSEIIEKLTKWWECNV